MKIITLADTHIKSGSLVAQLPRDLVRLIKDADMVIHAGDFVTKAAYDAIGKKLNTDFKGWLDFSTNTYRVFLHEVKKELNYMDYGYA